VSLVGAGDVASVCANADCIIEELLSIVGTTDNSSSANVTVIQFPILDLNTCLDTVIFYLYLFSME
jgi:hypothetical protein